MSHDWMRAVPDAELEELVHALAGTEGTPIGDFYSAALDELWRRHAEPIDDWPRETLAETLRPVEVVVYCYKARSPEDPAHRPARRRLVRVKDHAEAEHREVWDYECSCGSRHGDATALGIGKFWKLDPSPLWPLRLVAGVPRFVVCPNAPHVGGHEHGLRGGSAPGHFFCLCGRMYDEDEAKQMAAY